VSSCERLHTVVPERRQSYCAWHEWAEKKSRRHYQVKCPVCGLWKIWKRKPKDMADDELPEGQCD